MRDLPDWRGETVAIIGTGPSLTTGQLDLVRAAGVRSVAVGRAVDLAPWVDWLIVASTYSLCQRPEWLRLPCRISQVERLRPPPVPA